MCRSFNLLIIPTAIVLLIGCETSEEAGPNKTVAFYIQVQSSVPGVAIETNNAFAGRTPLTLKVFGDSEGIFHNFGMPEYTLRAVPSGTNEFVQTKVFKTGGRPGTGDKIPGVIFFDVSHPEG